jgi:hypothetical protein
MRARLGWAVIFALRLSALLPIPAGILMAVFTPNYTLQLVRSVPGIVVLVVALGFTAGGYVVSAVAARFVRGGRILLGLVLSLTSLVFCTFPALWLVFLGPAVLIFIQKTQ